MLVEYQSQTLHPEIITSSHKHGIPAATAQRESLSLSKFFYELLTTFLTTRNLSAWTWHWNNAKNRQITPLFFDKIGSPFSGNLKENQLTDLKQQIANFGLSGGTSKERLDSLQKQLDKERRRGDCYGASVNLLTYELQNANFEYTCSELLSDVAQSQERTIFFEEVELLRAKIEGELYLNQDQNEIFKKMKQHLQEQKQLLPGFTTTGEAEKGDYLNFEGMCKALESGTSQDAFILHGDSGECSHALAIVQNSYTGRFYFYDRADFPLSTGRMYAYNTALELQEALVSYLSSHYPDLSDSSSNWRLQQIALGNRDAHAGNAINLIKNLSLPR